MERHAAACRALLVELSEATNTRVTRLAACEVALASAGEASAHVRGGCWDIVALPLHLTQSDLLEMCVQASEHWVLVMPAGATEQVWAAEPSRSPAFVVDEEALPAAVRVLQERIAAIKALFSITPLLRHCPLQASLRQEAATAPKDGTEKARVNRFGRNLSGQPAAEELRQHSPRLRSGSDIGLFSRSLRVSPGSQPAPMERRRSGTRLARSRPPVVKHRLH